MSEIFEILSQERLIGMVLAEQEINKKLTASRDKWQKVADKLYGTTQCIQANPEEVLAEYRKLKAEER